MPFFTNGMKTISIFGDSIALGHNANNKEGWAHHLKKFLEERDTETNVVNLAVDGATSADVLKKIEGDCEKHKPSEIILAVGLNDSLYSFQEHRPVTIRDQFEKNITDILDIAKKYAKKIIVVGITRVDERGSTISGDGGTVYQYQNIMIQKYNDSLKGIANSGGDAFVSVYDILSDDDLDDGYHPNDGGHKKLSVEILRAL